MKTPLSGWITGLWMFISPFIGVILGVATYKKDVIILSSWGIYILIASGIVLISVCIVFSKNLNEVLNERKK